MAYHDDKVRFWSRKKPENRNNATQRVLIAVGRNHVRAGRGWFIVNRTSAMESALAKAAGARLAIWAGGRHGHCNVAVGFEEELDQ